MDAWCTGSSFFICLMYICTITVADTIPTSTVKHHSERASAKSYIACNVGKIKRTNQQSIMLLLMNHLSCNIPRTSRIMVWHLIWGIRKSITVLIPSLMESTTKAHTIPKSGKITKKAISEAYHMERRRRVKEGSVSTNTFQGKRERSGLSSTPRLSIEALSKLCRTSLLQTCSNISSWLTLANVGVVVGNVLLLSLGTIPST